MEESPDFFVSRHTHRSSSTNEGSDVYPGISKEGVEIAVERSDEILDIIKDAPDGAVIALCGVSEVERTRSTANVYTDSIERANKTGDLDCMTLELDRVNSDTISRVRGMIEGKDLDKIFVSMPLFIKQFRVGGKRWQNEDGSWASEYAKSVFERAKYDNHEALKIWINDYLNGTEGCLNPEDVAREHLEGIKRLEDFMGKIFLNRPLILGFVGHSPNIEALALYIKSDRKIDKSSLAFLDEVKLGESDILRFIKNENI